MERSAKRQSHFRGAFRLFGVWTFRRFAHYPAWAMAVSDYGYYNGTLNSWSITIQPAAAGAGTAVQSLARPEGGSAATSVPAQTAKTDSAALWGFPPVFQVDSRAALASAVPAPTSEGSKTADVFKPLTGRRAVDSIFARAYRQAVAERAAGADHLLAGIDLSARMTGSRMR